MTTIRWGILGLGKISHKFAQDLKTVQGAILYAVGSRSQDKADAFAQQYHVKKSYGSYKDLLKDKSVDVVYIATPNVFHCENTLSCLYAGKAVLCEKPFALNKHEVKKMISLARTKNLFLMEALWTNFMPTIETLMEFKIQNTYGKIKHLKAEFCFEAPFDPDKRLFNPKLGGGALLDIGIYPVYLALKLLGKPNYISSESKISSTQVDLETKIIFEYDSGVRADLFCSFDKTTPSEAFISYEKAEVKLNSRFHDTDKMSITTNEGTTLKDFAYQAKGYHFEIGHVQQCIKNGLTESPSMPFEFSTELIKTLDKIRKQIKLSYP